MLVYAAFDSVDEVDAAGDTPLHIAAAKGYVEVAQLLLQTAANPNSSNALEQRPLHVASGAAVASAIYHGGGQLGVVDRSGRTPLFVACAMNRPDVRGCGGCLCECVFVFVCARLLYAPSLCALNVFVCAGAGSGSGCAWFHARRSRPVVAGRRAAVRR